MTEDVSTPNDEDLATGATQAPESDATARLLDTLQRFAGDALRDVWLFDQWTHERLYARPDVAELVEDDSPAAESVIDNERYGYVTRDTYVDAVDDSYGYTVRGFGEFEQFRTFLVGDEERVGLFVGVDRSDEPHDFATLLASIEAVVDEYPLAEFVPASGME